MKPDLPDDNILGSLRSGPSPSIHTSTTSAKILLKLFIIFGFASSFALSMFYGIILTARISRKSALRELANLQDNPPALNGGSTLKTLPRARYHHSEDKGSAYKFGETPACVFYHSLEN